MKYLFGVVALVVSIGFTSCTELSDELEMTCKVDGNDYTATVVAATLKDDVLIVTGTSGIDEQCQIILYDCTSTGTYEIDMNFTEQHIGGFTNGTDPDKNVYVSSSGLGTGSITISALSDTNVEGTFQYTAKNSEGDEVSITDGVFKSKITQQ